jgi:hypothetical protein
MSTFSAKGTDIDVEAIMANIRRKIEEKRKGVYTEEEVREIAEMKLDAVLDANEFNSDFVSAFRARDEKWNYQFDPETIYRSSHAGGGGLIRALRSFLNPVLKLFFNPNPIISALSRQADLNRYYVLLLHNMAQELTRSNLELTNLKARLRTLGIRVDFQTKREKTMEQVVLERESREREAPEPRSYGELRESREHREPREPRPRPDSERGDRDRDRMPQGERQERGERDRDRERGERGDREGRRRGRGRRSFRRRRGGAGRSDAPGRPPSGRPGGGSGSGSSEGSGGNRS